MATNGDIREAYQSALTMATHEGDTIWARFNVIIVANSIVLLGLLTGNPHSVSIDFAPWLPIIGLVLCIGWLILMKRGFAYESLYISIARELESKLDGIPFNTLMLGRKFSHGLPTNVNGVAHEMGLLARIPSRYIVYLVIGVFIAMYLHLIFDKYHLTIAGSAVYIVLLQIDELFIYPAN